MPIQTNGNSISCHITQFQNYFIVAWPVTISFLLANYRWKKILSHNWHVLRPREKRICLLPPARWWESTSRSFGRRAYVEETAWAEATRSQQKKKNQRSRPRLGTCGRGRWLAVARGTGLGYGIRYSIPRRYIYPACQSLPPHAIPSWNRKIEIQTWKILCSTEKKPWIGDLKPEKIYWNRKIVISTGK